MITWHSWKILIFFAPCEFNGAIRYRAWWGRNRSFARFWRFARRASQDKDSPAKVNNEKERDYLIRKIQGLSLDELPLFCLDKVLTLSSIHITLSRVVIGSKHRGIRWGIFVGLALPVDFTAESSLSASLESLQQDVVHLMSSSDSSRRHCF